jgi:hypothetical protein
MKALRSPLGFALLIAGLLGWQGCSSSDSAATGDGQDVKSAPKSVHHCDILREKTQVLMADSEIEALNDPVSKLLLQGGKDTNSCPTTYEDLIAKLKTVNKNDKTCPTDLTLTTRFVSERAQQLGTADVGRLVVARECSSSDHSLFFLLDPVDGKATPNPKTGACQPLSKFLKKGPDARPLCFPTNVEIVAQDPDTKQLNYYALEKKKWTLYGTSFDFIDDGYTCDDSLGGGCKAKAAVETRCASCHQGGGLIMKEIHAPFVSWESADVTTPGASALIDQFTDLLGTRADGADLAARVTAANLEWLDARATFLRDTTSPKVPVTPKPTSASSVAEVLRPLFCTMEINLQAASKSRALDAIPPSFFVDPIWGVDSIGVPVTDANYKALLAQNGQTVLDTTGCGDSCEKALGTKQLGDRTDTFFPFTYPMRSQEDVDYAQALITRKIVTEDFVKDVLDVDFTRPIFSPARCGLLGFAPSGDATKMTPTDIAKGFIAALKNKGADQADPTSDPAAKLLANLTNNDDAPSHANEVSTFVQACAARGDAVLADALARLAHLRQAARLLQTDTKRDGTLGIIDFAETLPTDKLGDPAGAWDAVTCQLK